jgi:hypothetical protein
MNDVLMSADVNIHVHTFYCRLLIVKCSKWTVLPALIIRFFYVQYHELIPNGSTRFNGVANCHSGAIGDPDRRMFGLALSICPLASSGYNFGNRTKCAAYCPCCGFPGVENSPEASIVYLLTKKTHDRKPVCLMDVRRMRCSARISKEFSSSSLKNKDPKVFY